MIWHNWYWIVIGVVGFIVAMFIEDSREWLSEQWGYLISFEWFGDLWELFISMFEDIGEFSIGGLLFGVSSVALIYFLQDYMLMPFLQHMDGFSAIFWGGATYVGCFIVGYLAGKKMFDE